MNCNVPRFSNCSFFGLLRIGLFTLPFVILLMALCNNARQQNSDMNTGHDGDPFSMEQDAVFSQPFPSERDGYLLSRVSSTGLRMGDHAIACADLDGYLQCLKTDSDDLWVWTGAGALFLTNSSHWISHHSTTVQSPPARISVSDACDRESSSLRWAALRDGWLSQPWQLLGKLGLSAPKPGRPGYGIEVAPRQWMNELGLHLGDRVVAIDGLPLDARHIPKLVDRLVDAQQFSLTLWREGGFQALRYCIASAPAA